MSASYCPEFSTPPEASYRQGTTSHYARPPPYEAAIATCFNPGSITTSTYLEEQVQQVERSAIPITVSSRLEKPIAIPATLARYGSPFLRAYPPSLNSYSIPRETFLSFLDTLNRVAVKSPPLQVLGLAGNIVGFVPSAAAQIAGTAINVTAGVAAGVIQHGRTEIELKRANAELFGPRGLKVEIAKTEALLQLAGVPGVLDANGTLSKKSKLLLPLEGDESNNLSSVSAQQRRLHAMEPWIAELDLIPLPEINIPTNALSKLSVKVSERDRLKGEKKLLEKRVKANQDYQKEFRKVQKDYDKEIAKVEKDHEKDLRDIDGKLGGGRQGQKHRELAKLESQRERMEAGYQKDRAEVGIGDTRTTCRRSRMID